MEPQGHFRLAEGLFEAARYLDPAARERFLAERCVESPDLRAYVDRLLAAHDRSGPLLTPELRNTLPPEPEPLRRDDRVGPYQILERLGEGGMGVVYLAEQREPIRRQVALKVVKPGMDSRAVLARFEAERQALALMDHPHIARVLDAGSTEHARPFFAMELVHGEPITAYCDRHGLSNRERIALFVPVCQAVQHAHQRGVIHRDLKPSNILVTMQDGRPIPKIIDFGIAKAIASPLTDQTAHTHVGQILGTPEYMSPEQAEMGVLDIDTRSDIYSLGTVLYELLTGSLPFSRETLRAAGYAEIRRIIREVEPPRPSTRISTLGGAAADVAKRRHTDARKLTRELQRDLDWVLMKTLEKDRTRRYASVSDLAAELERFLRDEPVLAGPPSFSYRARKFAARHRTAVGAAAVTLLAIVITTAALAYALVESNRQRAAAELARAEAVAVRDFLKQMLKSADPNEEANPDLTVREAVERAAATVGDRFGEHPLVEAEIRQTIGELLVALRAGAAVPQLRRAYEIREHLLGPDDRATLTSLGYLAVQVEWSGETDEGEALHRKLVEATERAFGPADSTTCEALINFGRSLARPGRLAEAESCLARAGEMLPNVHATDEGRSALQSSLFNALWFLHLAQGDDERVLSVARRAASLSEERFGLSNPETLIALNNLAYSMAHVGRDAEALPILERALPVARALRGGSGNFGVAAMEKNLGHCLLALGRFAAAESLFTYLRDVDWGPLVPESNLRGHRILTGAGRAEAIAAQGRTSEAYREIRPLVDTLRSGGTDDRPWLDVVLLHYGRILVTMDSLDASLPVFEESARIAMEIRGPSRLTRRLALVDAAGVLERLGRTSEADSLLREVPAQFVAARRGRTVGSSE
ncbi:MAG: protein kinase domain-containing protein [Candidatus Eiseniibacteriota bacterium]